MAMAMAIERVSAECKLTSNIELCIFMDGLYREASLSTKHPIISFGKAVSIHYGNYHFKGRRCF